MRYIAHIELPDGGQTDRDIHGVVGIQAAYGVARTEIVREGETLRGVTEASETPPSEYLDVT